MITVLPQVGGTELLLILLVIILLLFGAKRIPQLAHSLGSGTRAFRKGISGVYDEEESGKGGDPSEGEEIVMTGRTPVAKQNAEAEQKL